MLKTALLFQDHMIVQHGKRVSVWGEASPGAKVTVTMQGKTAEAMADAEGKWKVVCEPFHVSFAEEMVIVSEREHITLKDVQAGEVWLAGGQSNMEFHMRYDSDMAEEKKHCANDAISFFDYPEVSYVGQINEADYKKNYGFWRKAEPQQLERFSAVAYYFAKELQNRYQIPVGIIGCNWGGTPACAWMPCDAVAKGGGQVWLNEYTEAVKDLDVEKYAEDFRKNPGSYQTDLLGNPFTELGMTCCSIEELTAKLMEMGIDLTETDLSCFTAQTGPMDPQRPGGLYESMVCQVAPYALRGVIWYQGESDGDRHPETYRTIFPELIRSWRALWDEELPFLFVQVAPLDEWMQMSKGEPYVQIREAQQFTTDTLENTGMAVITDAGLEHDVHPKKKQPVGHRLALLAENLVYGEDILCEAPTLTKVETADGKLTLTFENTGAGLYLSETVPGGQTVGAKHLGGLQVFQNGIELNAKNMETFASGNQVTVISEEIRGGADTEVRLACKGWYLVNLYNSADLPARPGRVKGV